MNNKKDILLSKQDIVCNTAPAENAQCVFIVGSKGIPGSYGGYETFVDKLTEYHQGDAGIQYFVACKANGKGVSEVIASKPDIYRYHNAVCFKVSVPDIGSAQAIGYDCRAIEQSLKYIKLYDIQHPILYILACRIGPWIGRYAERIHAFGGKIFVNPDGHEWMRAKWKKTVRRYWKWSEKLMVKHADLLICDSRNIEDYIGKAYQRYQPKTVYIAYGAEIGKYRTSSCDEKIEKWFERYGLSKKNYYLIVGRFVPENNFEIMIREFMESHSKHDLAVVTTADADFYRKLEKRICFERDHRVKFTGPVYNQELLGEIRENAYGYLHGHEVGGTNPSLLEALGSTELNLLLDVGFNRECGREGALYWTKDSGNLRNLIDKADSLGRKDITELGEKAKAIIAQNFSWPYIADRYKKTILGIHVC
jgi:rhamnosyltransferase